MYHSTPPKSRVITSSLLHIFLGLAFIFCVIQFANAQTVSHFDWENTPTTPVTGPQPLSVSGAASTSNGGANGTKGLNPGSSMQAINLVLPGALFDHDGIDISVDFQRDESFGYIWDRGNYLALRMIWGRLRIQYRVQNGAGQQTITANNIYQVPFDNTFRTYRFVYDATTGDGRLDVNGTTVWSHNSGPNKPLYVTNAPDFMIGRYMSGIGQNQPVYDNFMVSGTTMAPLPVELMAFAAVPEANETVVTWETATETNNATFRVERSSDGESFARLADVAGAGTTSKPNEYRLVDPAPLPGLSYYRLKQLDFDGREQVFDMVAVEHAATPTYTVEALIFPNPSSGREHSVLLWGLPPNREVTVSVYNTAGVRLSDIVATADEKGSAIARFSSSARLSPGTYLIAGAWDNDRITTKLIVNR